MLELQQDWALEENGAQQKDVLAKESAELQMKSKRFMASLTRWMRGATETGLHEDLMRAQTTAQVRLLSMM